MKYFGTDGIRGLANKDLSTTFSLNVGKALGILLEKKKKAKVLIGTDNRLSNNLIKFSMISGLLGYNVDVIDIGIVSTPAISYLTKLKNFDFGVMISASHNSYEYNGIKIFNSVGEKINHILEDKIEYLIDNINDYVPYQYLNIGNYTYDEKLKYIYFKFLKKEIQNKNFSFTIAIDCSNGATTEAITYIFGKYDNIRILNTNQDGKLINKNCGATNTKILENYTVKNKIDLSFSLDGDGDRLIVINSKGKKLTGDEILYLFSTYYKNQLKLKNNAIAITNLSNFGLDLSLNKLGIKTVRCDVGDKNVLIAMKNNHLVLGGEQSGHIIQLNKIPSGDGILNLITFINIIEENKKTTDLLLKNYKKLYQCTDNIKTTPENIKYLLNDSIIKKRISDIENALQEKGRILIRKSGTEPLIRILVETNNKSLSKKICKNLVEVFNNGISFLN